MKKQFLKISDLGLLNPMAVNVVGGKFGRGHRKHRKPDPCLRYGIPVPEYGIPGPIMRYGVPGPVPKYGIVDPDGPVCLYMIQPDVEN